MTPTTMWMVVVGYSEWLNWMAWGELRLHASRIGRVDGTGDCTGFGELMNQAPDLRVEDEQALVLAQLRPGFRAFLSDIPGSRTAAAAILSLEAVESFFPVTERAGRLLVADAHRARARLGAALFEDAWTNWSAVRRAADADRRGRGFAKVLGLAEPDVDGIPLSVRSCLTGEASPPNAELLGGLEGRCAYAWAATFGLLEPLVSQDAKQALAKELKLGELVKARKQEFSLLEPILQDSEGRTAVEALQTVLRERHGIDVCLFSFLVFWHYEQQLRKEKDISLASLVDDLAMLAAEQSPAVAATTAWLIGRLMHDAAVTTLLYATEPSRWPAVEAAPSIVSPRDVGERASKLKQLIRSSDRNAGGSACLSEPAAGQPPMAPAPQVLGEADAIATVPDPSEVVGPNASVIESLSGVAANDAASVVPDGDPAVSAAAASMEDQKQGAGESMAATYSEVMLANSTNAVPEATESKPALVSPSVTDIGAATSESDAVDRPNLRYGTLADVATSGHGTAADDSAANKSRVAATTPRDAGHEPDKAAAGSEGKKRAPSKQPSTTGPSPTASTTGEPADRPQEGQASGTASEASEAPQITSSAESSGVELDETKAKPVKQNNKKNNKPQALKGKKAVVAGTESDKQKGLVFSDSQ